MKKIFIGTSGYNYKHWRDIFYPKKLYQKDWLNYYSQHFKTVEINATFYRNFKKEMFEKWSKVTTKDFNFTIKGPRLITHTKRLRDVESYLQVFLDNILGLGEKLSVILWQFPQSFKNNEETKERLIKFLKLFPNSIQNSLEFRHESWFADNIYCLLNKNHAGFVINDTTAFPRKEAVTGDFIYIRFHGPASLYSSSYSDHELNAWAQKIKKYLEKYDVYCYFNNDAKGYAIRNAKELIELMA